MKWWRTLLYAAKLRFSHTRISPLIYMKGHNHISIGAHAEVHSAVTLDASRGGHLLIGNRVVLNRYVYLQADRCGIKIEDGVKINNYCVINGTGGVQIGENTLIGPGVKIISYTHEISGTQQICKQPTVGKPIVIGSDVWIGANVVVTCGVTIGKGAVIGAGAVVTHDIPAFAVAFGAPAKVHRTRQD